MTRRVRRIAVAIMAVWLGLTGWVVPTRAQAVELTVPFGNMMWNGTGYLYANAGETVHLDLRGRGGVYTATQADGTPVSFLHADGTNAGTTCSAPCLADVSPTVSGVWRLTAATSEPFNAVNTYLQTVDVQAADGTVIPGRFWFDTLVGSQYRYARTDVTLYVLSPYGTQWRVTLSQLAGYGSIFQFSNLGVTTVGTCTSAYVSVPVAGSTREPVGSLDGANYDTGAGCANLVTYRIFAEAPDPGMPTTAATWADGRTTNTWVNPAYVAPTIQNVTYAAAGTASHAGTIAATLQGQPGLVTLGLDIDHDGALTSPQDVVFPAHPTASGQTITENWDGKDGTGALVPVSSTVPILASYKGQDEVHFTLSDAEGLFGGLVVQQLVGAQTGNTLVSWDDSHLQVRTGDVAVPSPLAATDVDSSAGVRGYARALSGLIYGWGDTRLLDTWSYSKVPVVGNGVIPARRPELSVTKSASVATAAPGGTVQYDVTVTNTGTADLVPSDAAIITDTIVGGASEVAAVTDVTVSTGAATYPSPIRWTIGSLPVGASAHLTYTVTLTTATSSVDRSVLNWAFLGTTTPENCAAPGCAVAAVVIPHSTTATPTPTASTTPPTPTATATPTPPLASTGAPDMAPLALVSCVTLVAGALLVTRRRRPQHG